MQTLCENPTLAILACNVISKELISGLGIQNMFFYNLKLVINLNEVYDKM
jgi:hypothetical protein